MKLKSCYRYNQLRVAFDLLKKCNGGRILDIGCGNGILEQYFADRQVVGVDISLPALTEAKKNAPWAEYILADMRSLPLKDECVDNIAMIAVLGGLPEGEEVIAFREAKRVLKEGGHLIILVSQKRQPYSLLTPDRLFGGWKWRHFCPLLLQQQLQEEGFSIRKIIFAGGLLSLSTSLLNFFWRTFWRFFSKTIIRRVIIPPLPYRFLNKLESIEFHAFRGELKALARFFYVVARKA